jgi:hypothetical protein
LIVRSGKAADWSCDCKVAGHAIVDGSLREQLAPCRPESRVREVNRNRHVSRVVVADLECIVELACAELVVLDEQLVREARGVQIEAIRIVHAEDDVD